MLTKYAGGELVKGGIYWSLRDGQFVSVARKWGRLEGGAEHGYVKVPLLLVLILGPLMGLVYVVALPLAGLVVLAPFLAARIRFALSPAAARATVGAGAPGITHLEPPAEGDAETDGSRRHQELSLIDLASEIAMRRWKR